jgi:hypothetical protein
MSQFKCHLLWEPFPCPVEADSTEDLMADCLAQTCTNLSRCDEYFLGVPNPIFLLSMELQVLVPTMQQRFWALVVNSHLS